MKIVYCLNSLGEIGGISKVTVTKINALAQIEGNKIYAIITDVCQDNNFDLHPNITLIHLPINYYEYDWKSRLHSIYSSIVKKIKHKRELQKAIDIIKPDIIVSVGQAEKYMVLRLKTDAKILRELHFEKNFRYKYAKGPLDKIQAFISNIYDFTWSFKHYDKVIVLTEEDLKTNWSNHENVIYIHNPLTVPVKEFSINKREKKIISVGRLHRVKNFDILINVFSRIHKLYPEWRLEIWGEGNERNSLEMLIKKENLGDCISLPGSTNDINDKLSSASVFAFTSSCEGFALVLIEAMLNGVPPIAFKCPCGPADIITDGEDGILVENQNQKLFFKKLSSLIANESALENMRINSYRKALTYTPDKIAEKWMDVFESCLK